MVFAYISGSWTATGTNNISAYYLTDTKLTDGTVMVAGGETATYTNATELYNPSTNSWTTKAPLNQGRYNHTSHLITVSGGSTRVIVIGGHAGGSILSTAELYNPSTNTWSYTGNNMSHGRELHASVVLGNGKVIAIGGLYFGTPKADADLYDPVNNSWSTVASMSAARYNHSAVLLDDGRVFVTGGQNSGGALSSTEFYDPNTDTWSSGPSLNTARSAHKMVKLPSGDVLITGGTDSNGNPLYSAELWSSSLNTWSIVAPMTYRRYDHSMVVLSDGRVLVAGGRGGVLGASNTVLSSVEIYDPSTDTWDNTDSMITARMRFPLLLLNDGSVLAVKGLGSSGQVSASEYYVLAP